MAESDVGAVDVGDRTVSSGKVSLAVLTALGIGSMIGGGIFGLPQQMARAAAPGMETVRLLRERFPEMIDPPGEDICCILCR